MIRESRDQRAFDHSPGLIAACRALPRLLAPRHPPHALGSLAALIPSSARVATRSTQNQPSSHPALKTAKPQGPSNDPLLSPKAHAETRKSFRPDRRQSIDASTLTDATLAAPDLSKNKRLDGASLFSTRAREKFLSGGLEFVSIRVLKFNPLLQRSAQGGAHDRIPDNRFPANTLASARILLAKVALVAVSSKLGMNKRNGSG